MVAVVVNIGGGDGDGWVWRIIEHLCIEPVTLLLPAQH